MGHKINRRQVKWEGVITTIQENVLVNLAKYKYLGLSQLLQLNIGTTQYKYLWKQVSSLRDRRKPLVKCQRFGAVTTSQRQDNKPPERVEDWYYLSKEGEKALRLELGYEGNIKIPIGRKLAYKDYKHRRELINFQILLYQWGAVNQASISFFDTYFDKKGDNRVNKNLRAKTRIDFDGNDFFIPDAAFSLTYNGQSRFFLCEIYRGHDPVRTISQLHKHGLAMVHRFTHNAYNLLPNKSYTIVLVFERDGLKQSVIERIKREEPAFNKMEKYFRLKSVADLAEGDFFENWLTLHGSQVALL